LVWGGSSRVELCHLVELAGLEESQNACILSRMMFASSSLALPLYPATCDIAISSERAYLCLSVLHHLMTLLFDSRHFLWRRHGERFARTRG
jgi:hypothetical protein